MQDTQGKNTTKVRHFEHYVDPDTGRDVTLTYEPNGQVYREERETDPKTGHQTIYNFHPDNTVSQSSVPSAKEYLNAIAMTGPNAMGLTDTAGNIIKQSSGVGPIAKGLTSFANKTGISNIPKSLMASAVKLASHNPEVEQRLIDMGLMGTKNALKEQVEKNLASQGSTLNETIGNLKGTLKPDQYTQPLKDILASKTIEGSVPLENQAAVDIVNKHLADANNIGEINATQALARKRAAQNASSNLFKEGTSIPSPGTTKEVLRAKAQGYGQGLENMYASENPAATSNAVRESNRNLSALLQAKSGLEDTPTSGLEKLINLIKGASVVNTPLVKSTTAQALDKAGGLIAKGAEPAARVGVGAATRYGKAALEGASRIPADNISDFDKVATNIEDFDAEANK